MGTEAELATLKSPHDIVVQTQRLKLRPIYPLTDIHLIHRMRRNPNSMKYMTTGVETVEDPFKSSSYDRIKNMVAPESFSFAIELREADADGTSPMIGVMALFGPPALGYLFDEPYWGQGYATEALAAFVQTYWDHFPHGSPGLQPDQQDVLHAGVYEGNVASERVLRKVGFKELKRGVSETARGPVNDTTFSIGRPAKVTVPKQATEDIS